jgi:type VI secretion system protein ImpB
MAGKDQSVAPKERVNIVYKSLTNGAQEQTELPLKILMVGDYTGRPDSTPLEDRQPINIDKDNFNEVMAKQDLAVAVQVADRLSGEEDASMSVELKFNSLADFGPEGIVNQVPKLKKLLELRAALSALKGPLGNIPAFRNRIQAILGDSDQLQKLLREINE